MHGLLFPLTARCYIGELVAYDFGARLLQAHAFEHEKADARRHGSHVNVAELARKRGSATMSELSTVFGCIEQLFKVI